MHITGDGQVVLGSVIAVCCPSWRRFFVSADAQGHWYVSRMVIFCCAADALVQRVVVVGPPAPHRVQWVRVTGVWVDGTGLDFDEAAQITVERVVRITEPKDPYA